MASPSALRLFKGANWTDPGIGLRFSEAAGDVSTAELLQLFDFLSKLATDVDPIAYRNRSDAYVALVQKHTDKSLFGPLVKALKSVDGRTKKLIAKLLPIVNNVDEHEQLCALLGSKDERVRRVASHVLARVGGRRSLQWIEGRVGDRDFAGRIEAVDAALEMGGHHAFRSLQLAMNVGTRRERVHAIRALDDERYVSKDLNGALVLLRDMLGADEPVVVAAAALVFSKHANEPLWFRHVAPLMDEPSVEVAKAAVDGLRYFSSARAVDALERAFRIGPGRIRMASLDTAEAIGSDAIVPLLVEALAFRSPGIRNRAAEVLSALAESQRIEIVRAVLWLLRSRDGSVRRLAVEVVNRVEDPNAEVWPKLLRYVRDEDWWVRERVADALVEMAGQQLTPHIATYLLDDSDVVRRFAVTVLGRLADPKAIGALVRCAQDDDDWWVREEAIRVIGELNDPRAVPYIVELMTEEADLRLASVNALRALKAKDIAPAVGVLLEVEESSDVRLAIVECLDELDDPSQSARVAKATEDPSPQVRAIAQRMIGRWGASVSDQTIRTLEESMSTLELLLYGAVEAGADDLIIAAGAVPYIKLHGQILALGEAIVTEDDLSGMLHEALNDEQKTALAQLEDVDFSYELESQKLRFRANAFRQRTGTAAVFRVVRSDIRAVSELGLPDIAVEISSSPDGLVLVGGPTGAGKSTTLAALVDRINRTSARHVITLEDPIEVVHQPDKSQIIQRELGTHSRSYESALRATLRQDPDVILVGEARDLDTIAFAITAAETGHLVFATVHTVSADKSIDRLINVFPSGQQPQIRSMLASSLRAVLCQQLLARLDGNGRALAVEILLNTDAIANLIRKGKTYQIPAMVAMSRELGMRSMDLELQRLVKDRIVSVEEAYAKAVNKEEFVSVIRNQPVAKGTSRAAD